MPDGGLAKRLGDMLLLSVAVDAGRSGGDGMALAIDEGLLKKGENDGSKTRTNIFDNVRLDFMKGGVGGWVNCGVWTPPSSPNAASASSAETILGIEGHFSSFLKKGSTSTSAATEGLWDNNGEQ